MPMRRLSEYLRWTSIRWRIQFWYAIILTLVISGLLVVIYRFEAQRRVAEIEANASALMTSYIPLVDQQMRSAMQAEDQIPTRDVTLEQDSSDGRRSAAFPQRGMMGGARNFQDTPRGGMPMPGGNSFGGPPNRPPMRRGEGSFNGPPQGMRPPGMQRGRPGFESQERPMRPPMMGGSNVPNRQGGAQPPAMNRGGREQPLQQRGGARPQLPQAIDIAKSLEQPPTGGVDPGESDSIHQSGWEKRHAHISSGGFIASWNMNGKLTSSLGEVVEGYAPDKAVLDDRKKRQGGYFLLEKLGPARTTIVVGVPVAELEKGMVQFLWKIIGCGALILAVAVGVGVLVTGRLFRPIDEITSTAREIATGDLTQRITPDKSSAEMLGVMEILNECFDKLEANFAQQKQFTADASHELRTPVTVLLGTTQQMLSNVYDEREYQKGFAQCERSALRMKRLVDELTELSRYDSGEIRLEKEEESLDILVMSVLTDMQSIFDDHQATLRMDLSPAICEVDLGRVEQVVTNIAMNAIVHNESGINLHVSTRVKGDEVCLKIQDDGQGMSPEVQAKVFDRFARGNMKNKTGSGLGLAISKLIIEKHRGRIELSSTEGIGSEFRIYLPVLL